MTSHIGVIGSGFAGLTAAISLADMGHNVTLFEKNKNLGGRARQFSAEGFTFDMGPSWYWMPDVYDQFFSKFGKKVSDYYSLERLNPSYRVVFGKDDVVDIPASLDELKALFEELEPGSSNKLDKFLSEAEYKYRVGMQDLVYKPSKSITEFIDPKLIKGVFQLQVFQSIHAHIRKYFKHPKLIQLLEFPVLFLGAMPKDTPALYSLMNYADIVLGTWYPMGGMHKIVEAMVKLAEELGVKFIAGADVDKIEIIGRKATGVTVNEKFYPLDAIVGGGDYNHIEQNLLDKPFRTYTPEYWDKRKLSPSSLLFYLGVDDILDNLQHHNLFFDESFEKHAQQIYIKPEWPEAPLFYVCCPSKTDPSVAPHGKENLFVLIPLASGLEGDSKEVRDKYFNIVMDRLERQTGKPFREKIVFNKSYAHKEFKKDYYAFKGNAYGLANTLKQTAILKPSMHSKKVNNLIYTGQLTVPGPGVPPAIISGQVAASEISKIL
jgi:phytoene desaturase